MSNKRIKYSIPDKWLKLGVTSFLLNVLMQSKAFAIADISEVTAGVLPYYNPIYNYVKGGCNIITLVSALTFLISTIMIIIKKLKEKKQGENIKVSKKIKIVCIISIILLILSRIGYLIVNYLDY